MQTANEILKNILFVLGKIEQKGTSKEKASESSTNKTEGTKQIVNIATALASFAGVKEKTQKAFIDFSKQLVDITNNNKMDSLNTFADSLIALSRALPMLSQGLNSLAGGSLWGRTTRALNVLQRLYDLLANLGSSGKAASVERAIVLFDKLSVSLEKLAGPMKSLSMFMMYLGLSFVVFAAGLMLSSIILGSSNPLWGLTVLLGTIGILILVFMGIAKIETFINPGINTVKNMGKAFLFLVLGIMAFFVGMLIISALIGAGGGITGLGTVLLIMLAIVGVISLVFIILGLLEHPVKKGTSVINGIGFGFLILILGIYLFALGLISIAALLGESTNWKGIVSAGLIIMGVIVVIVGMFWLLGWADQKGHIKKGIGAVTGMGLGLFILIVAIFLFALGIVGIATMIGESGNEAGIAIAMGIIAGVIVGITFLFKILGSKNVAKNVALGALVAILISVALITIAISMMFLAEAANRMAKLMKTTGEMPDMEIPGVGKVPAGIAALGMIGIIFIASVIAFAIIGIPVVAGLVALGAAVAILISVALIAFAFSVITLVKTSQNLPADLSKKIATMISSVITGILNGISVLSGGATGVKGFINFAKNSAKLFVATGILLAASVALSMFAHALTAFARLDGMRPIIGTDKDGKPLFGPPTNISQVSANITSSITTFITALINSTDGLTKSKGKDLERMGRVLTGENGILAAVSQFADVLQTFAKFGNGEIGYVEMTATGEVDADGKPIMKPISKTIPINTVVSNIVTSFTNFVNELTKSTKNFEFTGISGLKMKYLAEVLMGSKGLKFMGLTTGKDRPGILEPIFKFADLLMKFSGADGTNIKYLDEKGEERVVSPEKAAQSLLGGIDKFITALAKGKFKSDIGGAEKVVGKFADLMDDLSDMDKSVNALAKVSTSLGKLADNITKLTKAMSGFVKDSDAANYLKTMKDIQKLEVETEASRKRAEEAEEAANKLKEKDDKAKEKLADKSTKKALQIELPPDFIDQIAKAVSESMKGSYNYKFSSSNTGEGIVTFKTK
jgi:hypothetical protein